MVELSENVCNQVGQVVWVLSSVEFNTIATLSLMRRLKSYGFGVALELDAGVS